MEIKEIEEQLGQVELMVSQVLLGLWDQLVPQDPQARLGKEEKLGTEVMLEQQDQLDQLVHQEVEDKMDNQEQLALEDLQDQQDHLDPREHVEQMARQENVVILEIWVLQENKAHKVLKDQEGSQETQGTEVQLVQ